MDELVRVVQGLYDVKRLALVEASESGRGHADEQEKKWDREFKFGGIHIFKSRLHMHLKQYLKGAIRSEVLDTSGEKRVLDAWRIMADRGYAFTEESLHTRLSKINTTKKAVAVKDVERTIAEWEREIEVYRLAKPDYIMDGDVQRMLLRQICPPQMQTYIRSLKDEEKCDYHRMKTAIHDWLSFPENLPAIKSCRIATCEQVPDDAEETYEQELELDDNSKQALLEADASGQLLALVTNGKLKIKKGKGKGKGQKAKRTCYECGSEEHLADKCQIRIDRIAVGGPARLDDPMGKGCKKGAGK